MLLCLGVRVRCGSMAWYVNEAGARSRDITLHAEPRRLEEIRARAELDHQHARREVDRLHLIVRLVGAQTSEGIGR